MFNSWQKLIRDNVGTLESFYVQRRGDNVGTLESSYVQRNNFGWLVSNYAAPCFVFRLETIISLPEVTLPVILSVLIALI